MARFRVMVKGGPVFLLDVQSQKTNRLGFFTTRWIRATTSDEACGAACKLVLEELAVTGTKNPPDVPVQTQIQEVVELSWSESLRHPSSGSMSPQEHGVESFGRLGGDLAAYRQIVMLYEATP